MYFSLAYRFRSSFLFGESRAKNLNMAKAFGVKKYPLLVAIVPKGCGKEPYGDKQQHELVRYTGDVSVDAISKWLDDLATTCRKQAASASNRERTRQRAEYGL